MTSPETTREVDPNDHLSVLSSTNESVSLTDPLTLSLLFRRWNHTRMNPTRSLIFFPFFMKGSLSRRRKSIEHSIPFFRWRGRLDFILFLSFYSFLILLLLLFPVYEMTCSKMFILLPRSQPNTHFQSLIHQTEIY